MKTTATLTPKQASSEIAIGATVTLFGAMVGATVLGTIGFVADSILNSDAWLTGLAGLFYGSLLGAVLGAAKANQIAVRKGSLIEKSASLATTAALVVVGLIMFGQML